MRLGTPIIPLLAIHGNAIVSRCIRPGNRAKNSFRLERRQIAG
jgi:hypothetical protein